MSTSTPIEARKIGYRQSAKDGMILSLAIHPDDMSPQLAAAPLGTRYAVALVEIGDDERPVEKQNAIVQRAGIICNDESFQRFLSDEFPLEWMRTVGDDAEKSATILREGCGVKSRRELAASEEAARKFDALLARFEMWKRGE